MYESSVGRVVPGQWTLRIMDVIIAILTYVIVSEFCTMVGASAGHLLHNSWFSIIRLL